MQSWLTVCDPMDCGPPGSFVHGILQARMLEWVDISFSISFWPRHWTQDSYIAGRFFTIWATRKAQWNISYKEKCIWVSSNEMDKPRAYYTEWSKSEKERQTSYIKVYTYMESRKIVSMTLLARQQRRYRHKEQISRCRGGRRGWNDLREKHWNIHITIRKTENQWEFAVS